jgi:UDP-GlcNAc3NAcA epimerase
MSDVFFKQLDLPRPDYQLNIYGGSHGSMTGRMLIEIEQVLLAERPQAVLVYGDTNSTLAGALAGVKLCIPVAHVEAGLRSYNQNMPEEINRKLTDQVSTWLFTPTAAAGKNLLKEGFSEDQIILVGDVMYDTALQFGSKTEGVEELLKKLKFRYKEYILATIHRAENTDNLERLRVILRALNRVAESKPVILPLHPRTLKAISENDSLHHACSNLKIIEPLGYLEMAQLERGASLIATDSGGVQKEAYFYKVPCVTLRDETEWVELVESGWNTLAPPHDEDKVYQIILSSLGKLGSDNELYGKGDASKKIVERLARDLKI